jgi:putative tryptophan/tyrosine transport system substrate-binding protein
MKRREFIAVLGGATIVGLSPSRSSSQPIAKTRRVGLLASASAEWRGTLVQALAALGYLEGHNLLLEVRSADGHLDLLPRLAEELIRADVEVIVSVNTPGAQAAIATGTKTPIVMAVVGDPVGTGFVPNLNRPGGTVTGVSNAGGEIASKRLELLKKAIPAARRIAVFTHPADPVSPVQVRQVEASAGSLGVELKVFHVIDTPEDVERVVTAAVAWHADAVYRTLAQGGLMIRKVQAELLLKHRLPAMLGRALTWDMAASCATTPTCPSIGHK